MLIRVSASVVVMSETGGKGVSRPDGNSSLTLLVPPIWFESRRMVVVVLVPSRGFESPPPFPTVLCSF